jgi:hypothetical protein
LCGGRPGLDAHGLAAVPLHTVGQALEVLLRATSAEVGTELCST